MTQPVTILVCALGGEGGGVLAEWLYDAARGAGLAAQCTSVPGVAQRTGATTYYIEIHPRPLAPGQRRPVFSLNPVPGGIDMLVSSELLETARQLGLGMASVERSLIISSTARALTVAEKMQLTDGRVDDARLLAALQRHGRAVELIDTLALARQAGTAVSAVLFGAIAASGVLPFGRAPCEEAIRAAGKGVQASLRGFALAFDTLAQRREQQAALTAALAPLKVGAEPAHQAPAAPAPPLPAALHQRFPPAVHELLAHAHARVLDYQDAAYAAQYVERLARVLAAERAADPTQAQSHAITREMTRWLALWMAFDDIVRVAQLKLAPSRLARVRREVAAHDDEIVKLYDHFKPGVPEFAALLPQGLGARLLAWDRRRVAAGRAPWALPLKLASHGVRGTLALRLVAALRGQRRRGSRFALEQQLIEQWLLAVEQGTREHWALGHELALCGRLIKGYGSTNERGKDKLLHIVQHLAAGEQAASQRADAVRAAREAALADEAGLAFDQVLQAHGAPARPPREQVLRFYKRKPAAPGAAAGTPR